MDTYQSIETSDGSFEDLEHLSNTININDTCVDTGGAQRCSNATLGNVDIPPRSLEFHCQHRKSILCLAQAMEFLGLLVDLHILQLKLASERIKQICKEAGQIQ